jgi:hypothetical protein
MVRWDQLWTNPDLVGRGLPEKSPWGMGFPFPQFNIGVNSKTAQQGR